MTTFAEGLARLDKHAEKYLKELDPRTATDLLPEWERLLGLPDVCSPDNQTLQQRREAAHSKFIQKGGQSKKYFIGLAKSLGYDITITTYKSFVAGLSRCGDPLNPLGMRFVWRVNVPGNRTYVFKTGQSATGEKLLKIVPATQLECLFRQLQPSHTTLYFNYE
jgi:uncharacterized protein YmfQ (DUF2313 family)